MRCKQGDLAVIVRCADLPQAVGRIVKCVAPRVIDGDPGWFVEPTICGWISVADRILRPIRPGDGTDETIEWAGKPIGAHAETIAECIQAMREAP